MEKEPCDRVLSLPCGVFTRGDLATFLAELVDSLFDADQLIGLQETPVYIFLLQPVAACVRSPPATGTLPTLAKMSVPDTKPSLCVFVHAKWKLQCPFAPSEAFRHWYLDKFETV